VLGARIGDIDTALGVDGDSPGILKDHAIGKRLVRNPDLLDEHHPSGPVQFGE
jgi:hypothetical protein